MGGSTLQFWVDKNYLHKLNLKQLHIYDSDIGSSKPQKYKRFIELLNERAGCYAYETKVREFENFIPSTTIKNYHAEWEDKSIEDWDGIDLPALIARITHEDSEAKKTWEEEDERKKRDKKSKAKNQ